MRGSIRGLSIAGIIFSAIFAIGLIIVGAIFLGNAVGILQDIAKSNPQTVVDLKLTVDVIKSFGTYMLVYGIVAAIGVVIGVLMIVNVGKAQTSKVFSIILGILGIVTGEIFITIAGIITIVYGAKEGK